MVSKPEMKNALSFIAAAALTVGAAACNSDDVSTVLSPQNPGSPLPVSSNYQPMKPEDLFAKQFKRVELKCAGYAAKGDSIPESAYPFETYSAQLLPQNNVSSEIVMNAVMPGVPISSPQMEIEPKLSAQDITQNGQLVSQLPMIEVHVSDSVIFAPISPEPMSDSTVRDLSVPSQMEAVIAHGFGHDDGHGPRINAYIEIRCQAEAL